MGGRLEKADVEKLTNSGYRVINSGSPELFDISVVKKPEPEYVRREDHPDGQ